jgi:hypothetical protein
MTPTLTGRPASKPGDPQRVVITGIRLETPDVIRLALQAAGTVIILSAVCGLVFGMFRAISS